jgi:hypothetical protein
MSDQTNQPMPPSCLGKNKGDEQWNDGVLWRWTGTYWKEVF